MFDIGFSELLLIAVVALVVLGPERLPKAARFTGLWVRRARAQWFSVKSELERELAAEELKRSLQEARQAAARLEETMRETGAEVEAKARALEDGARREVEELRRGLGNDPSHAPEPQAALEADASLDASTPAADAGDVGDAAWTTDAADRAGTADDGTRDAHDDGDAPDDARANAGETIEGDAGGDVDIGPGPGGADGGAPRQPDLPGVGPADMTDADDGRQR